MRLQAIRRRGLTLVELLVAAALSLVIMTVLASAFQTGMDTLSQLKSVGELQDRLRAASEKIKDDLKAPHFDDPAVIGGKLSEVRYDLGAADPRTGMFRVVQAGASYQEVGPTGSAKDYSTIASPGQKPGYTTAGFNFPLRPAASGGNAHAMQLAVRLDGKTRQKVFTAERPVYNPAAPALSDIIPGRALDTKLDNLVQTPATSYATRWAVVSYFLADSGTKTGNGTPLFNLHRRVQLVAEEPGAELNPAGPKFQAFRNIYSTRQEGTAVKLNTVADLAVNAFRPAAFAPIGDGSDVVLGNVISFEIKANWDSPIYRKLPPVPVGVPSGGIGDVPNLDFPFDDLPVVLGTPPALTPIPVNTSSQFEANPRIFDTAGIQTPELLLGVPATNHAKVRINAIQIKLRIWDPRNRTARQMTIVQDM